jgi:cytoskeletal protein RodZ
MTTKNNPYRRLGQLLHHARNHQRLSLFETSQRTGISVPKLISIEEARMKYYEDNFVEAIERTQSYARFLQVDAEDLIREISQAIK